MSANRRRVPRVADPVHGYIELTPLELLILRQPVFQRLRNVSQNGLAQYVFPSVVTTRFAHSLGTMHTSSHFLASALRNARAPVTERIAEGIASMLSGLGEGSGLMTGLDIVEKMSDHNALVTGVEATRGFEQAVLFCEQALRLAALFHDLGHLPLSHDFEYALQRHHTSSWFENFKMDGYGPGALHEQIGHQLAWLVFRVIRTSDQFESGLDPELMSCLFQAAIKILRSPKPEKLANFTSDSTPIADQVVAWLHSLIDGELDADRSDYILRDGRSYGFSFADYDLERLADHIGVHVVDGVLQTVVEARGLSALESYLYARLQLYLNGIFHHKNVQIGGALQYVVRLSIEAGLLSELLSLIEEILAVEEGGQRLRPEKCRDLLNRYAAHDDVWFLHMLRSEDAAVIDSHWKDLVTFRRPGPRSLWKRREDFPGDVIAIAEFNERLERLSRRWETRGARVRDVVMDGITYGSDNTGQPLIVALLDAFSPWKIYEPSKPEETKAHGERPGSSPAGISEPDGPRSVLRVISDPKKLSGGDSSSAEPNLEHASVLSPTIARLRDIWMSSIQVYAFEADEGTVTSQEVMRNILDWLDKIESTLEANDDDVA